MILDNLSILNNQPRADRHSLSGFVEVGGVGAGRMVCVVDRATVTIIAATVSDPVTGAWELSGLLQYPTQQLLVLALDNTGAFNAAVADYVSQVTV